MKKLLALLLCLLMILSVSACSKKTDDTTNNDSQDDTADVDPNAKSEGVMTYAEYAAVPSDGSTEVTIEAYVQGSQSYWNGASMYLQDQDGGYFVYNLGDGAIVNIDEENFAKCIDVTDPYFGLGKGTKVKVTGYKSEWSGEVEIADAKIEVLADAPTWTAEATEVTNLLGKDELIDYQNQKVKFIGLEVAPSYDKDGNECAFLYNYDGSGEPGSNSDLYFNVLYNGQEYNFCVESYLAYEGTDVYKTVESLNVGDYIDCEAFLYWYNGANPHVYNVSVNAK